MFSILVIVASLVALVLDFIGSKRFGSLPRDRRLEKIKASPNYRDGKFQNLSHTPDLAEGVTYGRVMYDFFFKRSPQNKPPAPLPSVQTDLKSKAGKDAVTWFGHSSYLLELSDKTILVDPVFSGHASPVTFSTPAFHGADVYKARDMPPIDMLVLTHDHWDHLDFRTLLELKPSIKRIVTGLGTGAHLQRWGFDPAIVHELDWNHSVDLGEGFTMTALPARHFSGRGLKRNQVLWLSIMLTTPEKKIYIGGDSGYDAHFKSIGAQFGPIDLAILECGQYNLYWKYIHMLPHEVVAAAKDLHARNLLPVHWGKFALSIHGWDEPIKQVQAAAAGKDISLWHPMIGQRILIDAPGPFREWWLDVKK